MISSEMIRYCSVPLLVKLYNTTQNGENVHMITQWLKSVYRELNFEDSEYEHIVVKLGSSFVYSSC